MQSTDPVPAIRRRLPGSTVIDASVGADGNCNGRHEGNPDSPIKPGANSPIMRAKIAVSGSPAGLESPICPASRAHLRFGFNQIPPGKTIISARPIITYWGQSGDRMIPNTNSL
ncbi:hypothetical protein [Roseiflexus castenholzii]|uniref:hypothetical protein n=1 Tax=Roseiflexus castenholzii TaxID=120962 RepID=UPI003C7AADC2